MQAANGCRMLFTTRDPLSFLPLGEKLALGDEAFVNHKMKSLDDVKSWELLLKTLFFGTSDKKFPKHLKEKGKRVLKICDGLPLAIKEVGRHWAEMIGSGSKWEEVVESIDLSETLKILGRSYNSWSDEMKLCFSCLSFFREGATIRSKKLKYICTIEGLLHPGECLFNIRALSEAHVIEFKNTIDNPTGKCRINPLFQMLSIIEAQDKMGLEILNKDGNNRPSHEPRRRVVYCSREKYDYSTNQDKHIVSLYFQGGYFDTKTSNWNSFKQLKILDMEDFGLKMLPDGIEMLSKLIYLGLTNNYIKELPSSLGKLKKLEVLDIAQNFMVEVTDKIWEMDSLCHLYMSGINCQKPLKIYALKNLKSLSYISMYSWTYELSSLEEMSSLRELGIEEVDENSDVSKLCVSLAKLGELRYLILRGFCFRRMPSLNELGILQNLGGLKLDGLLTRLPSVSNFPPKISNLVLVNSCLDEDPMPILEKLPKLWSLKLENAYTGQQMVISSHGFGNLSYLYIAELWHLRNIQVGEGGMPQLEELEINNCPYLETLPEETRPKELKMVTTKNIATKLRKSRVSSRKWKVEIKP